MEAIFIEKKTIPFQSILLLHVTTFSSVIPVKQKEPYAYITA